MSSGYRRNYLQIEQDIGTHDGSGFYVENWQPFAPVFKAFGRFVANRGESYWAAAQVQSEVVGHIETLYIPDLVELLNTDLSKVRIKMDNRYFKVDSFFDPEERKRKIRMMVKEELL